MIGFRRHLNKRRKGQILILYFCAYIASSQDDCQVELTYEAAIANGTDAPDKKTKFVGRFTLHNRINDTGIESWRLAFQFTDQERISDQRDILTKNVSLVGNYENDIVMEWSAGSSSQAVAPEESSTYKFLGYKDVSQSNVTVASLSDVQFSNLECQEYHQLELPQSSEIQEVEPEDPQVEIQYKSIESMQNSQVALQQYSVFFIDVFSRGNKTINLKDLTLFYYFEGASNMEPNDFSAQCIDSKPLACTNVTLSIERGVVGSPGAQNQLQIGFAPKAGFLLAEEYSSEVPRQYIIEQTGASAYTKISLIIAISSRTAFNLMNITRDYSFVDAPLVGISNVSDGGQVSLRSEIPNKKIPAYFNKELIAGITPQWDSQLGLADNATGSCTMTHNNNDSHVCSIVVTYCCRSQNNERLLADYLGESPIAPIPVQVGVLGPSEGKQPCPDNPQELCNISPQQITPTGSSDDNTAASLVWIISIVVVLCLFFLLCMYIIYARFRKAYKHRNNQSHLKSPVSQVNLMGSTGVGGLELSQRDFGDMTGGGMRYFSRIIGFVPGTDMTGVTGRLNGPGDTFQNGNENGGGDARARVKKEGGKIVEDEPLLMSHRRWQTMPSLPSTEWSSFTAKFLAENSTPEDSAMANDIHSGKTWNEIFDSDWDQSDVPQMLQDRMDAGGVSDALLPPQNLPAPVMLSSPMSHLVDLNVDFEKEIQPYLGRVLGSGGFGKVYEAEWKGQKVAVKVINEGVFNEGSDAYDALKAEVEMSCKISGQCDRVVRILGASLKDFDNMCIIMELVQGGSLADRIYNKSKRRLSYLEILQIAYDISCALAYLHPTIIHRDLKPQNILMDEQGRAKIADFGISRFKDPDATHLSVTQPNGTPSYMAPEMFNGTKVDEKCDVYSVGVILWECITRRKPWNEHSRFAQIIMSVAIMGERLKVPENTPPLLRRLIEHCWDADPQRRPSTQEIMRNTEVYIQRELQSIQTKNPHRSRSQISSSSAALERKQQNNGDSWSSKLAGMRNDVNDAVTKFEKRAGHQINCQGPSVEDIRMIDGNDTGGSLQHHISLPSNFEINQHLSQTPPPSNLLKQGSDPLKTLQQSTIRCSDSEGGEQGGPSGRQQRISAKTSLSTINSKSSGFQSDLSAGSQEGGVHRIRKLSHENTTTPYNSNLSSLRSQYMSANESTQHSQDAFLR